ncbi:FecR family protein [Filimonas lacunae]|uniref:FecR family protein n=1 Tax=Filimonas lacunae TaxID=477680 RepID=A0A173MIP4_9BACT|nr:FecR family protein [Filimonas lacunae]BAV07360.1 anti-sigma factor [Filimonas lacunae]SIS90769.1 FecR family protein [Filimonas lacunae]
MKKWTQQFNEYLTSQLKANELEAFLQGSVQHDAEINAVIEELLQEGAMRGMGTEEQRIRILEKIRQQQQRKGILRHMWPLYRYLSAAAVVLLAVAGTWWLFRDIPRRDRLESATHIQPASDKATLTLSNGQTIVLNQTANNTIEDANGVKILNFSGGQLSYQQQAKGGPAGFNTLATPRGGQYHVILPDGSRVWLNTASSIRFPLAFNGTQRTVEITGEAYLEVAANPHQPFIVTTPHQQVQVLGTRFNINAYSDEVEAATTLLQGKVAVRSGTQQSLLQPGQQAITAQANPGIRVTEADTSGIVSWMNDKFVFTRADISGVMRKIQRWYAVEVLFEKGFDQHSKFSGSISMSQNLAEVLKVLELSGVQFEVADHTVTVLAGNKR